MSVFERIIMKRYFAKLDEHIPTCIDKFYAYREGFDNKSKPMGDVAKEILIGKLRSLGYC